MSTGNMAKSRILSDNTQPSKLSEADIKFLDTIVAANPSLYLDEIQQRLRDVREVDQGFDCNSCEGTKRALASLDLSRKQITNAASIH